MGSRGTEETEERIYTHIYISVYKKWNDEHYTIEIE